MNPMQDEASAVVLEEASDQLELAAVAPPSLGRLLLKGSSSLGIATLLERGLGFIANLGAARLGGAHVFGAYSIAMTTATNVASYAGAGIGTTANRFSGEHPYGGPSYKGLIRTLAMVSLASTAVAIAILYFAAAPLAVYLVRNPGLAPLLRLAAFSAGAIILLECLRGLLIGQRRFVALLTLSALFGGGMALALPLAASRGPSQMVKCQAAVAVAAVVICVLASRRLQFAPTTSRLPSRGGPSPALVTRFGLVQLAGMIGLSASGWWIASLVARADISLTQAGWYAIASQLRNICAMPAWLISQTAYAQLTDHGGNQYGGPARVTQISTIVASIVSLLVSGTAAVLMPWVIPHLYGKGYANAELAASLGVATGLMHMSAAPAAARLAVVSLRLTGFVNAAWSVLLIVLGTWLIPNHGAAEATVGVLVAHLFSAIASLLMLSHLGSVTTELIYATLPAIVGSVLIAVLAWLRAFSPHKVGFSALMLGTVVGLLAITIFNGQRTSGAFKGLAIYGAGFFKSS